MRIMRIIWGGILPAMLPSVAGAAFSMRRSRRMVQPCNVPERKELSAIRLAGLP